MSVYINNLSFSVSSNEQSNIRSRLQSSTNRRSDRYKSDKSFRPKSTPIKLNPDGLDSFYLTKRTQTAPIVTDRPQFSICDRSNKSQAENVKPYRFPSAPGKMRVSPSANNANQPSDEIPQVYNLGPGYVIYRNSSQFAIRIDSDEFFGSRKKLERQKSTKQHFQDHKDIVISQLEEQISNLTVFLEEEKINHNLSIVKWQDRLDLTRKTLIDNYTNEIEDINKDHRTVIANLERSNMIKSENQRRELEERINKGNEELNTYKASFESYRQALAKETDNKMQTEKNQLLQEYSEKLMEKLNKQKNDMKYNFEIDLENIKSEHSSEIEQIRSRHKTEVEVLNRRFADTLAVEERLSVTLQEVEKKKRDYQRLQAEYDTMYQTYLKSRRELTIALNENENLKLDVQEFSDRFEERVKRVDDDYKQRIDSLQNQIVEIRRAYMAKCEELVGERNQSDTLLHDRIENAKGVMKELIHTRQRARISLVSLDAGFDVEEVRNKPGQSRHVFQVKDRNSSLDQVSNQVEFGSRPVSAPTTDQDERRVKQHSILINKNIL